MADKHWNIELGLRAEHLKLATKLGVSSSELCDLVLLDEVDGVYRRCCQLKLDKPGYIDFASFTVTFTGERRLAMEPMTLRWPSIRRSALRWRQRKLLHGIRGAIQWGSMEVKGMALEAKGAK